MTAPIPDDAKTKFARRRVPLRRYGEPEEVAHAILSLVLPASSYINGAVLGLKRRIVRTRRSRASAIMGFTSFASQ